MAKQLNVDLRFTANNAQAKQQIQDLQSALEKLMTASSKSSSGLGITKDIAQATSEVAKLQAMLESSKNASGGLDLGKFNQSLAQGQVKISDYAKTLSSLGPQGDQAFAKLAKAIINAEVPLKRTNSLLKEFKTSLANTARWQLSSSMLHGFMGAVQSAYGYAQDLNESLNNIRIVTGQNIEQMATFAKEANKAAQALSTTTTEYTDASLIYYQQGLSDSEVAKRTEVTIKMANAAGQSAQIVSDQLTAVWNNFYDGSKSLEYYADVMTALGAATASSTDEIAGGLEKFAAIGETIGLSYEYAASALATITSNTRQSEEVVGTALKTIFARIQGLNLGETLDDGTSLNKYSAALEKIGISIFEQSGEIKKMDNILNELAAKWGTLAKDQQIALAQTVAGVRQYTQLIALMDNWDAGDSDSMVANLDTAYNATGALQEQADIYAESWEAARDRVTAAAEEIYNQLLNDEFFIDLNNGFAGFLNIVSNTIDALGGLPGVLTVASSIMFKMFGKDMAKAIDDWGYNIKLRSKEGVQSLMELREQAKDALKTMYADNVDTGHINSTSQVAFSEYAALTDVVLMKQKELTAQGQMLSEEDQKQVQYLLRANEAYGEQAILSAKSLEAAEQQTREIEMQLRYAVQKQNAKNPQDKKLDFKTTLKPQIDEAQKAQMQYSSLYDVFLKLKQLQNKGLNSATIIKELTEMSNQAKAAGLDISHFDAVLDSLNSGDSVVVTLNAIESNLDDLALEALNTAETVKNSLTGMGMDGAQVDAILDQLIESWRQQGIVTADLAEKLKNIKVNGDAATEAINKMQGPPPTVGQKFIAVANTISNIAMSISAVKGLIDTWNNDDMSFGEKLLSTFTTLGMVIPMVTTALTGNNLALLGSASSSIVAAAGFKGVDIAAKMAAGGVGALWAALWPIALAAAAIAAAIAILVVTIKAISDAYNADAIAAEQAEKAASNLADAYNEAKQEYQDMIAAMDNYKSARDALDNLTEGTKEYEAALKEANRAALELINKYGLIEGQDYNWEGDQLVIKDDAMDRVSSTKEAEIDQAYAASQMADANAKAARSKANLTEARRDIRDANGLGDGDRAWQGVINGITAAIGIALTPATGGLSLAATALAASASLNSDAKAAEMDAAITKAVEVAREDQNLFDTKEAMAKALNIDINDTELVDALWANQEEIKSLAQEMNAAEAAWKLAAQNSANEILNDNEAVQNSNNTEEVMAVGGKVYGAAYNEAYNKYLSDAQSRGLFNTGTEASKAAFEEYAKKAGLDQLKNFEVTNYKGDGTVEYKYIDEEGKEQVKLATAEEIAATLAAAEATTKLGASAEKLVDIFNTLDDSGNEAARALKNIIAYGDVENATRAEFQDLQEEYENADDKTAYLNEVFGGADGVIDEEELKALGYESIEALQVGVEEAIENGEDAWRDVGKSLTNTARTTFKNSMKSGMFDDLTLEQTNQIANLFKEAFENGGVEGLNSLQSNLSIMFEKSGKDASEMATILGNVDWQTTNIEDLTAMLEEAGIETDGFADELANLIELMQEGQNIGFDGAAEIYKTAHEIIDDLETRDTISSEDYENLKDMGINMSDYFVQMADGSYKLTADAKEFYDIVNSKSLEQFQNNIQNLTQQKNDVNALQNSGYTKDSIATMETTGFWGRITQDNDKLDNQLTFLKAIGSDLEGLDSYIQEIEAGGELTQSQLRAIRDELEENAWQWDNLSEVTDGFDTEIQRNMDAVAMSAQTVDELNQMLEDGIVNVDAYAKAIESVGTAEIEALGLDPDEFENLSEMIEESGSAIAGLSDDLKGNEREANDVAKAIMRYDKAVESVNENSEDWMKTLKSGNLQDQAAIMDDLAEAYGNMMDIDGSQLSDSFLQSAENLELMQKAAAGSEEAYDALMLKMQEDIIAQCDLDTTKFDAAKDALDAELAALNFETLEIGANLNTDAALTAMTDLVNAANMTAEQATAYLASMGVDAEVVEEPNVTTDTVEYQGSDSSLRPNYAVAKYPSFFGSTYRTMVTYDEVVTPTAVTETVEKENTAVALKVTSANKSSGGNFKHSNSSSGSGTKKKKSSGGGGGSKKTPTPAKQQKVSNESDVVDRYHTTNEKLDDLSKALDKSARAADRLWSKERLQYLDEQNELLQDEIDLLKAKRKEAQDYLAEDTSALEAAAAKAGFSVTYDENGVITNYRSMMETLADQLIAAENQMNTFATQEEQDAYEQTVLEPLRKKIEELEAAIATYEETLGILEDTDKEIEEKQDQIMQNNYDKIMGTLKINIEVNDRDLELLDYYLSKIEDDFYSAAEAAALMVGQLDTSSTMGGQMGEYFQQLKEYSNALDELNAQHAVGQITDAAYEEGLEEIRSSLLDNLEAIQELDQAMLEYYSNTLSMANEEIDKYVKRMEHQTSVLEHYGNMMEILGKEMDYESMGEILQGQVDTIQNEMEVAEATYNMYQQQADEKKALLDDAITRGNTAAAEVYQAEWEAANEAAMEAQSDMLDKTEEWAQAMRAVVENKLAGLAKSLEEALTGGTSFDEMTTSIERATSLQEEYLTTTNQIYETNKLMRQAQQEIDKTNNTVAKQRLKDFIVETDQLQEKSKLSQYELEIQQAKYNLLLAEIALEEAQNAKSTVRLQRDSEGNFGYVYTADQDQVAQAQQELEDAQNSLYNIALEGANDYTEKYSETLQEMYDTLTSIQEAWLNGEIATQEEYDRQMLAAQEYYYQKLEDYSSLYTIAVTTDTGVIKDAWSSGFSDMIYKTETWKEAVNTYSNEAKQTLVDWYAKVDEIANKTGLDNIAGKVKAITDESEALKTALLGEDGKSGVIQAIKDELTAVSNLTGGYANLRSTIQGLIADYEKMMKTVNNAQNQQTNAQHTVSTGNGGTSGDADTSSSRKTTSSDSGSSDNTAPSGTGNGTPTIAVGQTVTVKTSATHFSRDGGNGTRMRSFVPGSTYSVMDYDDDEVQIGKNGIVTGWVKKTDIVGFNTGGYTGEWGPYGKLAFLDEKELILNEGDTANFLASMELLSHILEIIDLQSATAQLGGLLTTPNYAEAMNEIIEQNVHIEASFPAVQDRNEIEEAFNTLINRASQYANRK